jgi:MoaA/NifB/PqqE/SkfB family radical SAM enzyme
MSGQQRGYLRKANYEAFENFLVAKYERLAGVSKTRSYPYIMTIDPTNICQLRCPACYTGIHNNIRKVHHAVYGQNKLARLPGTVLDTIFDECGDVVFYCQFYNWGEPLLNAALPDFIRSASRREIHTKIDTNLSLKCSDALLENLLLSGLDVLSASIDGFSQATYEKYRIGGRFDLALENLGRLAEMRDRLGSRTLLRWKFLIFSFNEHEISDAAAFCAARNIEFIPADAVVPEKEWMPSYKREGKPNPYQGSRRASPPRTPAGVVPVYPGRPEGRTCGWHYSYTTVNADGGVLPCCGLSKQADNFGKVTSEPGSFGKIWNNAHFETVRREFPLGEGKNASGPTTVCAQCTRPQSMLDHYRQFDREIIFKYWSLAEEAPARQLDEFYTLLQKSPSEFANAFAARYSALSPKRNNDTNNFEIAAS